MIPGGGASLPHTGPGPVSPSILLSDRAADEIRGHSAAASAADPLTRALRALDSISDELGMVREQEASAEQGASGVEPSLNAAATGEAGSSATPSGELRGVIAEPELEAEPAPPLSAGAARREEILDGASALFAERGYHGASLRDISRKVGVSHPGMLHHFSSKSALLGAVIDRLEAHAKGLLDSCEQLSTSPQALSAALGGPWHPAEHPVALLATLSAEIVDPEHPGRFRIARLRLVHEHVLETVLTAYRDNGQLIEGADPAFIARSTFSLLLSLAVREKSVRALQTTKTAEPVEDVRSFVEHYVQ